MSWHCCQQWRANNRNCADNIWLNHGLLIYQRENAVKNEKEPSFMVFPQQLQWRTLSKLRQTRLRNNNSQTLKLLSQQHLRRPVSKKKVELGWVLLLLLLLLPFPVRWTQNNDESPTELCLKYVSVVNPHESLYCLLFLVLKVMTFPWFTCVFRQHHVLSTF